MGRPLSPPQIHQKIIWMLRSTSTKQLLNTGRGYQHPERQPILFKGGRTKYKRQKKRDHFKSPQFSSVGSLWSHGLQHTRLPCPSPTLRACSNSCPSSRWCHPTTSSSVVPFSSCLQSFPASGCFQWVSSLHQVAKVLEFHLRLNMKIKWPVKAT